MNAVACRITKHTLAIHAFQLKPEKSVDSLPQFYQQ